MGEAADGLVAPSKDSSSQGRNLKSLSLSFSSGLLSSSFNFAAKKKALSSDLKESLTKRVAFEKL